MNEKYCPAGIVEIYQNGRLVNTVHNMIVKSGRKMIMDKCFGSGSLDISNLKIYLSNKSDAVTADEELPNLVEINTTPAQVQNELEWTFTGAFSGANANLGAISSLGLYLNTTNTEFSRVTFLSYPVGEKYSYKFVYHIYF